MFRISCICTQNIGLLMIITKLQGGLGNQMFQYAAGRSLSLKLNQPLKLDLSWFTKMEGCTPRLYELSIFPIEAVIASNDEVLKFSKINHTFVERVVNKLVGNKKKFSKSIINESDWNFIYDIKPPVLLSGYWQNQKYFLDTKMYLKKDFIFPEITEIENKDIRKKIFENNNSVSIHVRRGDYVTSDHTRLVHGICSLNYYKNAVEIIKKSVKSPFYFIFSDEPDWCKKKFNFLDNKKFMIISHNTNKNSFRDMQLMTFCKHHIIANSSFSWWGAWLSDNENKIVIAPERWFSDVEMSKRGQIEIVPEGWTKI